MTFAKLVFYAAGIWGLVVLTPLFFLVDLTGRHYPSPVEYPQFYYGFMAVALTWQFGFLLIGSDPARFRLLMILAVVEKFGFVSTLIVLYARRRISSVDFQPAAPDFILMVLFVIAFIKTGSSTRTANDRPRRTPLSS
jgi:hypothetical protein